VTPYVDAVLLKNFLRIAHMTTHRAREVNYSYIRNDPDFKPSWVPTGKRADVYQKNRMFYKTHKFYGILGLEHDASYDDVVKRAKSLRKGVVEGSDRFYELMPAINCLTSRVMRPIYDIHGDVQLVPPLHRHMPNARWFPRIPSENKVFIPEMEQPWDWDFDEFKKEFGKRQHFEQMKKEFKQKHTEKNAGKLSTHDQFGASTLNPYLILNDGVLT